MNDAERQLIDGLFQRIRGVEAARRDPEAEAFISEQVAQQPHAPYAMAQTIVVQDRSIEAAKARIAQLEDELEAARAEASRAQSEPAAPGPSPWGPRAQESMARAENAGGGFGQSREGFSPPFGAPQTSGGYGQQQPGYGGQQPYGAPQQRYEEPSRGGGFLSGALQTAAGVAAGALVFQGVRSMFGGDEAKAGDAAKVGGEGAEAAGSGADTGSIGDWYSGLWGGGSDDKQAASTPQPAVGDQPGGGHDHGGPDDDDGFDLGGDDDSGWA